MSEWGKGVLNNNVGWGQGFDNPIGWGAVYANSYNGQTVLSQVVNNIQTIINNFKTRVENDGGTFEAESNLLSILTSVDTTIGLSKVNMILTPNAFKTGKAYNVIGSTDFAVLRNTNASRVNSSGVLVTEGSNIMRINYLFGTPIILDELQSTNVVLFSEQFENAYYTKAGSTITVNTDISPDNNLTADKLLETAISGNHTMFRLGFNINSIFTVSIFVKYLNKQWISLNAFNGSSNKSWFDVINGQIGIVNSGVTAKIESFDNGWYRISASVSGNNSNCGIGIDFANSNGGGNNYTGNTTLGYSIFGSQVEISSSASSYIPTTTAAVTRNNDLLTVTPPAGTLRITTTFLDNTTQVLNTIPATFTLPTGQIRQTVFQSSL